MVVLQFAENNRMSTLHFSSSWPPWRGQARPPPVTDQVIVPAYSQQRSKFRRFHFINHMNQRRSFLSWKPRYHFTSVMACDHLEIASLPISIAYRK